MVFGFASCLFSDLLVSYLTEFWMLRWRAKKHLALFFRKHQAKAYPNLIGKTQGRLVDLLQGRCVNCLLFWYFNCYPTQDGPYRGCSRMGAKKLRLPNICRTYPTMINFGTVMPYLKKTQKIYKSCDTPL